MRKTYSSPELNVLLNEVDVLTASPVGEGSDIVDVSGSFSWEG